MRKNFGNSNIPAQQNGSPAEAGLTAVIPSTREKQTAAKTADPAIEKVSMAAAFQAAAIKVLSYTLGFPANLSRSSHSPTQHCATN